ncbi:hypothetical protein [Asticcacaulis sp. AC466]|uniref:hypothetical protein n=1 Tax=Asticcacaulis sp. AC466 TaxID=1282362 RepID=UPI0012DF06E8|nr:hypothetical protein [Asticcacaulis sp. AC466]
MRVSDLVLVAFCGLAINTTTEAKVFSVKLPKEVTSKPDIRKLAIETMASKSGAAWTPPGAISSSGEVILKGRQYFTPTPAGDVQISLPTGRTTLGALDSAQLSKVFDIVDESVQIEEINADGSIVSPVAGGTIKKGFYQVTYYYYRYTTVPCARGAPGSGGIAIGSGLRVTAVLSSAKSNVSVSGFMPLALAASNNRVQGHLRVQAFGIGSGTNTISSYLSGASDLNPETIRKAVESFGVVKAVFETSNLTLSPNYLFVESDDIGKCLADLATPST